MQTDLTFSEPSVNAVDIAMAASLIPLGGEAHGAFPRRAFPTLTCLGAETHRDKGM